ncbi:ComEC/Rec2 family competence protein, partial [Desulfovibrio sp. OttesenSCG-928-C06]|nr:ComEC/Rec2 family competence protein [Desulfovibrio sp. OttesenSCG-928-C06]
GESFKWPALLYRQFLLLAWGAGIFAFRYPLQGLTAAAVIALLCLWQIRARFRARCGLARPGARELWAIALLAAAFTSGWCYGAWHEPQQGPVPQWVVEASEPSESSQTYKKGLRLRGVVREATGQTDGRLRLILDNLRPVETVVEYSTTNTSGKIDNLPGGLVFVWYDPLPLRPVAGQEVEAALRIRRVHSLMNFDLWEQESYWADRGVWYRAWGRADGPEIQILPTSEPGVAREQIQNPAQGPIQEPVQKPAWELTHEPAQEPAHELARDTALGLAHELVQEAASEQYGLPVRMALWREDLRQRVLSALPQSEGQSSKDQPDGLSALRTMPRLPETPGAKGAPEAPEAADKPPGTHIKPGANFIPALLFGDKSLMSSAESELLARSTLAHSLALSGLHLGYAAAIGYALARLLFHIFPALAAYMPRRRAEALAALLPALAYTWLGGAPPSLLRSLLMLVFWALLLFCKKPSVLLDGLFWAVGLILLFDPGSLFDLRLQMSALAIAAIAIAMPLLIAACRRVGNRLSGNVSTIRQRGWPVGSGINSISGMGNTGGTCSINGNHGSYRTITESSNFRSLHGQHVQHSPNEAPSQRGQHGQSEARGPYGQCDQRGQCKPRKSRWQPVQRSGSFLRRAAVRLLQSAIIMLGTSFAVQVFLMPLLVRSFGIYGLAFPLNLFWLPVLGFLVMPASLLGLGAAALGLEGLAGLLFQAAAWPCAKLIDLLSALDAASLLPVTLPSRPHWLFMIGWWLLLALLPLFISRLLEALRARRKARSAGSGKKSTGNSSIPVLNPAPAPDQNFCQKTGSEPAAGLVTALGSKTLGLLTACKNKSFPNRLAAPLLFACLGLLFCISPYFIRVYETGREAVRLRLLDVGQGQSILLEWTGGGRLLLDGGGGNSPRLDIGRSIVTATLLENRPPRLDYMLASHPDQDHTQGLLFALEHLDIGYFADNGTPATRIAEDLKNGKASFKNRSYTRLLELLEQRDLERNSLYAGDTLVLLPSHTGAATTQATIIADAGASPLAQTTASTAAPELVLEILHPPRNWAAPQRSPRATGVFSDNNASLVARLVWQGQPLALLCGDIEREAQRQMLASLPPQALQAPVLVLPHHGSANASLEEFYRAVNPQLALVSCGYGNQWNFPSRAVVQRLQKLGIPLLNTAESGQIVLEWTAESLVKNLAQNPAQSQAQPLTVNQHAPLAPSVATSRTSRP